MDALGSHLSTLSWTAFSWRLTSASGPVNSRRGKVIGVCGSMTTITDTFLPSAIRRYASPALGHGGSRTQQRASRSAVASQKGTSRSAWRAKASKTAASVWPLCHWNSKATGRSVS
uniref:Uncharacterized protein n=1 Tax=Ixodes ricinus TaxID=34613 RepID=A0A6B0ULJ6_IXORI